MLQDVTNKLQRSPKKSFRRLSPDTSISLRSAHKAVQKLKFRPYKVHVVQEVKSQDSRARINFCRWFNNFKADNEDGIIGKSFFTDEAWSHLSEYINSQNSRFWSTHNPHALLEKFLYDRRNEVWHAVTMSHIIGPIFFEETINSTQFVSGILEPFFFELTVEERQTGLF